MSEIIPFKPKSGTFRYRNLGLNPKEVSKIVHEINSLYHTKYKGLRYVIHPSVDLQGSYCLYYVEIMDFNDYCIFEKIYD